MQMVAQVLVYQGIADVGLDAGRLRHPGKQSGALDASLTMCRCLEGWPSTS